MDNMENTEIWKSCKEAPGVLEVSNLGRVRTIERASRVYGRMRNGTVQGEFVQIRRGQLLKPCKARHGYYEIAIQINGKRTKFRVHRLVASNFVDGYFPGATVDHVDGNKENNRADNLEWVSLSENTRRQWETGLVNLRGELAPGAKLSNLQANAVITLRQNGYPVQAIAEWFDVSTACIYKIAQGRRHLTSTPAR
jgi:hypothetical protein